MAITYTGTPRRGRVHMVGYVTLPDELYIEVYGEDHQEVRAAMLARLSTLQAALAEEIAALEAAPAPETVYPEE